MWWAGNTDVAVALAFHKIEQIDEAVESILKYIL